MILKREDGTFIIDGPLGPYGIGVGSPEYEAVQALISTGTPSQMVTDETEREYDALAEPLVWPLVSAAVTEADGGTPSNPTAVEVLRSRFNTDPVGVEREWRDAISAKRLERLKDGFIHSDGNTYPIDPEAQTIFTAVFTLALASAPVEYMARTSDNRNVEMSAVEFTTFAFAAFAAGNAINRKAFEAKDLIAASKDFYTKYEVYLRYME